MHLRLRLFLLLFLIAFPALIARLAYWQIYKGRELSIAASNQYKSGYALKAFRGDIFANDGTWLVAGAQAWLVYASLPELTEKPKSVAEKLAPLFVDQQEEDEDLKKQMLLAEIDRIENLLDRDGVWVAIKQKIDGDTKRRIEDLAIEGIGFELEEGRVYPEGSVAAQLLGFVGKNASGEDEGYFGLEGNYNFSLTGKPGYISYESDAAGVPMLLGETEEILAIGGVNLQTHVDKSIQFNIEKKLVEGIER
jgi:cell division protein FtsI/penicillin-binding protein 2